MVTILIVEDEGLFRDMLKISLGSLTDLEVVGAVSDGNAAVEAADRLLPDVVLMDIELGCDPNGIAAGRAIKEQHPEIGIIILSAHKEREYLNLMAAQELSGWSYLLKQSVTNAEALVRAIAGAASGLVVMDPSVVDKMRPRQGSLTAGLTPRQQEVLAMMAQGYNNSAIAEHLVLGTKSVENYINAIYQELSLNHNGPLHPRVQAVLSYIRDSD
ncbi:MAG: response regulator transcription factor [Chloroflexi bacterium]|nr:response regulator transcription factor [Chloroflexota bacterium]MCH8224616.1 response regulator transcription factor [Chloroflexota bacterium]MCI0846645.1 response regulator transcription factor [Chloroflexota bacterium]